MSEPNAIHTTPRRQLLALVPSTLMAADIGLTTASAVAATSPDAELIQVCQQFAEREFSSWYRYVVALPKMADALDTAPDWAALRQIEATPARTPAGHQAKALALTAWHRGVYDDHPDDHDGHTALLASLLRDMVAPARVAIIARLAKRYGPLPEGYTADGVWVGRIAA